jgi:hypothetical protein
MATAVTAFAAELKDGTVVLVHAGDEFPDDHELVARDKAGELFAKEPARAKARSR